mmetsp:Transcript_2397/g.3379  ORF Transcript_2397/g.3379 Transcript_2397/m.3379 type:complete len:258 (-) Transcript_2397:519-1292(-)|eukprot:CAMPEP_0117742784 /NCGR_PEP_ID=MMETSP0947-20121206/5742_1 /TAXON_ID=44440 /ORGANISM="Chattonella subsalsa, Strain CCMP2191" /LENGTH=257 /DNA_ID=CAMNT_0005559353 /DNA_START=192 /DNA_END=965 /DNA_ORIENTATION=+
MEGCLQVISDRQVFLHTQQRAGSVPTPSQLADFFRNLIERLKIHIIQCDNEVVGYLEKQFSDFGWNVVSNKSIRTCPPTLDEVVRFIDFLKTYLENSKVSHDTPRIHDMKGDQKTAELIESSPAISMASDRISLGNGVYQAHRGMYSIGSGDGDNAYLWAGKDRLRKIWKKEDDVLDAYEWVMEKPDERIPPRTGAESRLFWLMRRLWEGCDSAHTVLDNCWALMEWPERHDPGRLKAMAPLAKKLLGYIHEDEQEF